MLSGDGQADRRLMLETPNFCLLQSDGRNPAITGNYPNYGDGAPEAGEE